MAVALASVVRDRIAGITVRWSREEGGKVLPESWERLHRGRPPPRSVSGWTSVEGAWVVSAAPRVLPVPFARRRRDGAMGSICHPAERPRPQVGSTLRRWSVKWVPARVSWVHVVVSSFTGLVSLDTSVVRSAHAGPQATAEQEGGPPTRVATGRPGR